MNHCRRETKLMNNGEDSKVNNRVSDNNNSHLMKTQ